MAFNYRNIEQPVKRLIQDKIRALGLVKSGKFLNSITVKGDTKGLTVTGVDGPACLVFLPLVRSSVLTFA